jgi:CarD family transcriptional regulator
MLTTAGPRVNFQVGEKVVYPNHGVAVIENVSARIFAGHFERFYLLRLAYNSLMVMVPFSHVGDLGLRRVTRNGEVARVVSFLSKGRCRRHTDWKDRFRENTEKMQNGSLLAVAEVMKSLLILQAQKPLSFREKKMLDRARRMLIMEFSTSRGLDEAQAAGMLDDALAKARLRLPQPL